MKQFLFFRWDKSTSEPSFKLLLLNVPCIILVTGMTLLLSSCDKEKKETCGPDKEYTLLTTDFASNHYYSNNKAFFQYSSPLIENVCPDQHVKVQAFINLITNLQPTVSSRVYGSYSLFFAPNIPLDKTNEIVPGQEKQFVYFGDFGIKQSFGSNPGAFYVTAEIFFDTLGDFKKDSTYFTQVFKTINLLVYYKAFKQ